MKTTSKHRINIAYKTYWDACRQHDATHNVTQCKFAASIRLKLLKRTATGRTFMVMHPQLWMIAKMRYGL